MFAFSDAIDKKISKCPSEDINDARKNYAIEQVKISRTGGRVVRDGLRLELRAGKRLVVLKDDCSDSESYARYSFEGHLTDISYLLVSVTSYEGGGYLLINERSGTQESISGTPLVSPDKKRIVTTSMDFMAGYSNKTIEVWRLTVAGLEEEYSYDTFKENVCGASNARWLDNKTIEFTFKCAVSDTSDLATTTKATLIMRRGKWELLKLKM
jgi:hypothetical protein